MNAGQVIGDNFWLWRADHSIGGASVTGGFYPCLHGLVVNGDSVAMYGLAAEHTLEDLTVWRGDKGATYFYQSELPYDVSEEAPLKADEGTVVALAGQANDCSPVL